MAWTATGGGDHEGADWIISASTIVGGAHTGIHTFEVALGATATINGPSSTPVAFEVQAISIFVDGSIAGAGKGYSGGLGGAGVFAGSCYGTCPSSCGGSASAGGNGSAGYGPYPGAPNSGIGGYGAAGSNGDNSTTQTIAHGSGGAGGRAGNSCTPNCYANCNTNCNCSTAANSNRCRGGWGGPGGAGGAAIKLIASSLIQISGTVDSRGANNNVGGNGESDSCGYGNPGYTSGAGAGGGTLLICKGTYGIKITGTVDTRGGNSSTVNYGSCKLFGVKNRISTAGAALYTGHNGSGGYGYPLLNDNLAARAIIF